ncbi:MAG: pyroglutamyl-peptidase I [Rhizobiales bacterium]|nr:pyroglutamyl-peptidase I [Hyphomicrobiales bacterium]
MHILLTGFGPFPGAPFNPTKRLVEMLARSRLLALAGAQQTSHVFVTSYEDVDRDLPALLARTRPEVWVMFGLATRTRHVRIETRARNARSRVFSDAGGRKPRTGTIAPGAAASLALRAPAQRLVAAARSTGVRTALSHDAGRYLCNYLCWRATEAAAGPNGPKITAFVHVPKVRATPGGHGAPLTLSQLVRAGEAIVRAAIAAARTAR